YSHRSILLTWDCRGCSLSRLNQPNRCYVIRMPGGVRGGKPRGFSLSRLLLETIKSNGSIIPQSFSKEKIALLEKELEKIMIVTGAKGISACFGIPDNCIWCSARGITDNTSKVKIASDLKFYAGSIGKTFAAILILNLIEEGQLGLEDPVTKWFPEISWASHVTISHLLAHTTGIASFDNTKEDESKKYLYRNPEEILFKPGQHYAYSNTGYLMLGIIIERVTGRSYREAVEHNIINKINLHKTDVITSEIINDLIVKGHHKGNVLIESENSVVPFAAGSIAATPRDLIIFFQAFMGGRLLSQGSLHIIFSDINLMTVTQSTYYGKAMVAALGTPAGNIVGHTGSIKGFGVSLFYHPKRNIFVCVMMNDDIKAIDPAVFKFLKVMMEF
ncbi:MAG: serine hydrolase domain-containing protein, partial [Thermodesulfobacteriota bacterium]|nr:serine hydrolase domain-containing protein [Thermodesulfobacteriota bacterium]